MFWIKKSKTDKNSGYLYLRETLYIRDKRSLKRKPRKLGDGSGKLNRSKYSKKIDTYCGRVFDVEPVHLDTFNSYIEKKTNMDFLEYKLSSSFDEILADFTNYLLYLFTIDREEFYSEKKKVYFTGVGFLCKETIEWVRKFNLRGSSENKNELERFGNRCQDMGIYDVDIIGLLFTKLSNTKDIMEEEIDVSTLETKEYANFKSFMKKEHDD